VLDQLHQHSAGRARMQKGDPGPAGPCPWLRVDGLVAGVAGARDLAGQVARPVGDVMEPAPSLLEEPTDRAVGVRGLDELELAHEGDPDALTRHRFDR
jgi:hypothetical protein